MNRVALLCVSFALLAACGADEESVESANRVDAGGLSGPGGTDVVGDDVSSSEATDTAPSGTPDGSPDEVADVEGHGGEHPTERPENPPEHVAGYIDQVVRNIDGEYVILSEYRGQVMIVVNVASQCAYTPQYADLQVLQETYGDEIAILAFPSNEFGGQEPGSDEEIQEFAEGSYHVSFPLFSKVEVNGNKRDPVYVTLCEESSPEMNGDIRWNFTKFIIGRDGLPAYRFESAVSPTSAAFVEALEEVLAAPYTAE